MRDPDRIVSISRHWFVLAGEYASDIAWIIGEDEWERIEVEENIMGDTVVKVWDTQNP